MHGEAYKQSSIIARDHGGPFLAYDENREPFLRVINKHRDAAYKIPSDQAVPEDMIKAARAVYDEALELGEVNGYRNAQVTVLAPTGTIAFMMDCDTTGIEPDIALIKYKKLVGEGFLKIVNQTVPSALRKLGYGAEQVDGDPRLHQRARDDRGRAAPQAAAPDGLRLRVQAGQRRAVDPLHGPRPDDGRDPAVHLRARSARPSTCPRPPRAEEIEKVYLEGWKLGLKAIAVYRDNSKRSQPLSTGKKKDGDAVDYRDGRSPSCSKELAKAQAEAGKPHRRRLPSERTAVTHKFDIAGHEGYITVGLYPDGQPGEIFLKMAKEGSTVSGLMDTFATTVSRGAPVRRAAARPRQQVRPRPVRAVGLHGQPGDPDREVDHRLHLPVARLAVPRAGRQGGARAHRSVREVGVALAFGLAGRLRPPSALTAQRLTPLCLTGTPGPTAGGRRRLRRRRKPTRPTSRGLHSRSRRLRRAEPTAEQPVTKTGHERLRQGRDDAGGRGHQRACQDRQRQDATARHDDPVAGHDERRLQDPGGRPELRRMRLDHGPQRQLLQVPELRLNERLQLRDHRVMNDA